MYLYINIKLHHCKANYNAKKCQWTTHSTKTWFDWGPNPCRVLPRIKDHANVNLLAWMHQLIAQNTAALVYTTGTHSLRAHSFLSTSSNKQQSQHRTRSDSSACVSFSKFWKNWQSFDIRIAAACSQITCPKPALHIFRYRCRTPCSPACCSRGPPFGCFVCWRTLDIEARGRTIERHAGCAMSLSRIQKFVLLLLHRRQIAIFLVEILDMRSIRTSVASVALVRTAWLGCRVWRCTGLWRPSASVGIRSLLSEPLIWQPLQ